MGEMYIAECINCGYKTDILSFGGGMLDFTTFNGEPAINFDTKEIEVANGKERDKIEKENPNMGFLFHNEELYKKHQGYSIDFGGDIGVKEFKDRTLYLCPKCNEFKIEFWWQGMWD
jgi:hypothetical protein